jgi:8-oxo-dGTP pyrophosphatase MutT (NUDIX family)
MILAQKAVIRRGETFLVLKRSDSERAFPGLWDLPGGKWERGEDLLESLKREVREETSLEIVPWDAPLGVYRAEVKPGVPVEFSIYSVKQFSGVVRIGAEHSAFDWKRKEDILSLAVMPYMAQFFKEHHRGV